MEQLHSDRFKSEYLRHQIEDNHGRFLILPIITGVIGLLFMARNIYIHSPENIDRLVNIYFWAWAILAFISVIFRVLFSAVNQKQNLKLLDKSTMLYGIVMCCIAAAITALDSLKGSDFTAYTFATLGMATAYRASMVKYLVIMSSTLLFFVYFYFFFLEQPFDLLFLLPLIVIKTVSVFIAVSLENNRRKMLRLSKKLEQTNEKLKEESIRDPLTKLYNRRYLTDYLMREVKEYARSKEAFCVALCDLDHFKSINDKLGHLTGDEVLISFAEIMRSVCRDTDIHIRFGGEEFVIVMPRTQLEQAKISLERLRITTEKHQFANVPWSQTISIGLTEIKPEDDYDSLLARADSLVYEAKSYGRNRTHAG